MNSNILIEFGRVIREIRLLKEISQEDLADLTGFHRTYIGMIERGERNLSLKNMQVLADTLNTPLSKILSECEKKLNLS